MTEYLAENPEYKELVEKVALVQIIDHIKPHAMRGRTEKGVPFSRFLGIYLAKKYILHD